MKKKTENSIGFKLSVDKTGKDQGKANYANAYIGFPVQRDYRGRITGSGQMNLAYGNNRRPDIYSKTTLEAILHGERTATTRFSFQGNIAYWKKFKAGDIIKWKNQSKISYVEILQPLSKLSAHLNAEDWSKKEGWSTAYFNDKVKPNLEYAYQMEFKPVALSSTGVYLLDARQQGIPCNYAIEASGETIAFVSVSSEGLHIDQTVALAVKTVKAGGAIIMDRGGSGFGQSHSKFNRNGEGVVQDTITSILGKPGQTPQGYHYWGEHYILRQGL